MTACNHGKEKEELRQLEELEEIDVTEWAEDDDNLVSVFEEKAHQEKAHQEKAHQEKAHQEKEHQEEAHQDKAHQEKILCNDIKIEKLSTFTGLVQTSHQKPTAVVVSLNDGDGGVRFFRQDKELGTRQVRHGATNRATMVFLGPIHSFWLIGNVSVKYITHSRELEDAGSYK